MAELIYFTGFIVTYTYLVTNEAPTRDKADLFLFVILPAPVLSGMWPMLLIVFLLTKLDL